MGTLEALKRRMIGGWTLGGMIWRIACATLVTWAMATPTSAPWWKKILMTATPLSVCDSTFLMSLTLPLMAYSLKVVMPLLELLGVHALVGPDHGDDGDVDLGKDVGAASGGRR